MEAARVLPTQQIIDGFVHHNPLQCFEHVSESEKFAIDWRPRATRRAVGQLRTLTAAVHGHHGREPNRGRRRASECRGSELLAGLGALFESSPRPESEFSPRADTSTSAAPQISECVSAEVGIRFEVCDLSPEHARNPRDQRLWQCVRAIRTFAKSSRARGRMVPHLCPDGWCHQVGYGMMTAGASRELLSTCGRNIAERETCSSEHANYPTCISSISPTGSISSLLLRVLARRYQNRGVMGVDWCTGSTDSEFGPTSSLRALSEGGCHFLCTLFVDTPLVYAYSRQLGDPFGLPLLLVCIHV